MSHQTILTWSPVVCQVIALIAILAVGIYRVGEVEKRQAAQLATVEKVQDQLGVINVDRAVINQKLDTIQSTLCELRQDLRRSGEKFATLY